jgi:hypothetical protein
MALMEASAEENRRRAAEDRITTPPTATGRYGRAWEIDLPATLAKRGAKAETSSGVVSWVVEAPWAHPFIHSHYLYVCHLRANPAVPPPIIHLPGATHEFWLYAIDPSQPRQPMIETGAVVGMHPITFAAQLVEASDEAAANTVYLAVAAIIEGRLSPDADHRRVWGELFGFNMLRR